MAHTKLGEQPANTAGDLPAVGFPGNGIRINR